MSIGLKSDSGGTSGSIIINGSDKVVITSAGNVTASTFTGAVVGNVTGSLTAGGSLTSGVAVATTSGTAIDFTSIPSWVRRITVIFNEVSTTGVNHILVQLGDSGGIENTGYVSTSVTTDSAGASNGVTRTDGYALNTANAANLNSTLMQIVNVSGNIWIESHSGKITTLNIVCGGGSKTLSDTLDRVRVTTVGATDTFDNGSVNIMYEG